jgi:hypothetical protein
MNVNVETETEAAQFTEEEYINGFLLQCVHEKGPVHHSASVLLYRVKWYSDQSSAPDPSLDHIKSVHCNSPQLYVTKNVA